MFLIWDKQRDSQWKEFGKWFSGPQRHNEPADRIVVSLAEIKDRHFTNWELYNYMEEVFDHLKPKGSLNIVKHLDESAVPEFLCDLPVMEGRKPAKRKIIL